MNYKELLNRTIEKSDLKNVEIIKALKDRNITITPNYLSVLRNGENKIPSVEISRAIAEICNAPAELLVIQGDIDKLENGLKKYIDFSIDSIFKSANIPMELLGTEEQKRALAEMCPADFICDYLDNPDVYESTTNELLDAIKKGLKTNVKYAIVPMPSNENVKVVDSLDDIKG